MRYLIIALLLSGCASGASLVMPKLPGPADQVDCIISRSDSSEGTYECTVKGRYVMEGVGLF